MKARSGINEHHITYQSKIKCPYCDNLIAIEMRQHMTNDKMTLSTIPEIKKRAKRRGLSELSRIMIATVLLMFGALAFSIEYQLNLNKVVAGFAFWFWVFTVTMLAFYFWRLKEDRK